MLKGAMTTPGINSNNSNNHNNVHGGV